MKRSPLCRPRRVSLWEALVFAGLLGMGLLASFLCLIVALSH